MSIKENNSILEFTVAFNDSSGVGGVVASPILDTANFDGGFSLVMSLNTVVSHGNVEMINLVESNDAGMAGATTVPAINIVGDLVSMAISGNSANNTELPSIGIVGNKRFITFDIDFVALTGDIAVTVAAVKTREITIAEF